MLNGIAGNEELYPPEKNGKGRHRGTEMNDEEKALEFKAKGRQHSIGAKPGDEHLRKDERGMQKGLGKNQGKETGDRFARQSNRPGNVGG
jgi:hypothetical protein